MGFNCGIVGLPNVGKSTLFNALTRTAAAEAANYPFCTIEPNTGRVSVPDPRLDNLAQLAQSANVIPTQLEFVDIAGLVRGAAKGEGLGNQFLANIREVDAIAHVVRCFEDGDITHVEGKIDPIADIETIETELMLADLDSLEKRVVGLEKKGGTATLAARQNELVAYHEAGHAVVGALIPDYDQVQKISIIPRSNGAGGLTFFAPQEARLESGMYSRQYLESQLAVALGGRLAEEIIYGEDGVTTGASNDFRQVANIAKRMVKEWGMSPEVGLVALETPQSGGPFMGRSMGQQQTRWGSKIMGTVDMEVERLVNNSYLKAKQIIEDNRDLLDLLAKTLVDQEVVSSEEFQMMIVQCGSKTADFKVIGEEQKRADLPFQDLPELQAI